MLLVVGCHCWTLALMNILAYDLQWFPILFGAPNVYGHIGQYVLGNWIQNEDHFKACRKSRTSWGDPKRKFEQGVVVTPSAVLIPRDFWLSLVHILCTFWWKKNFGDGIWYTIFSSLWVLILSLFSHFFNARWRRGAVSFGWGHSQLCQVGSHHAWRCWYVGLERGFVDPNSCWYAQNHWAKKKTKHLSLKY